MHDVVADDVEPYHMETDLVHTDCCISLDVPLISDRDGRADRFSL